MKQQNFPNGKHLLFSSALCMFLAANALPVNAIEADAVSVVQQTTKLKGVILDAKNGEPIIGANVLVKGTTNGTITNFDGEYELDAPAGSVLVISYIGYKPVEVKATQGKQTVKLDEDTETLDEVVVVGLYYPEEGKFDWCDEYHQE